MGNVLAELFADQANAIREGLGDIGKFPPAEFAERIRDIVALIGTGGGSGDSGGTGGGESGGTGGGAGTGLKVTSGTFTVPDYDVDISISTSAFASSDRYPGLYVYEVSPAILPLATGDAYYFQLGGQFWNPATGAKIFDALGQYAACYATGNVNLIEPDYSGNSSDTLLPYLCIYIEREDKNVVFTSMKINGMQVNFLKMDSLSGTKTIVHGLDVMPDFICVQHNYLAQALTKGAPLNSFLSAWAVKSDFANYFGEVLGAVAYSEGGTEIKYGLDDAANNVNARIRCRNDTTFMVGGTVKWYPKASYYWVAISGLGSSGGGDVVIEGVDPYYQQLAEAMMLRDPKYLGDAEVLNLKTFVDSDGDKMATLAPYSFAGFNATGMEFSDLVFIYENALRDCPNLKIIDITMTDLIPSIGILAGALTGCSALESIIVRDGGGGVGSVGCVVDNGANDTFCVYVPSSFYDKIVSQLGSNNIAASRYRKLEDYPDVDFWNEKYTVNFYDGDTLLHTETVKHGGSSTYTYKKDGYSFGGWTPSPTKVTKDMNCYGAWGPIFEECSAAALKETFEAGKADAYFTVGQKRIIPITLYDNTVVNVEFAIRKATGNTVTLISTNVFNYAFWCDESSGHSLNTSDTNAWKDSHLRDDYNNKIYNGISFDLRELVMLVANRSEYSLGDGVSNSTLAATTDDYIWIPSANEMNALFPTKSERIKREQTKTGVGTAAVQYATRDMRTYKYFRPAYVHTDGTVYKNTTANTPYSVSYAPVAFTLGVG